MEGNKGENGRKNKFKGVIMTKMRPGNAQERRGERIKGESRGE